MDKFENSKIRGSVTEERRGFEKNGYRKWNQHQKLP